MNVHHHTNPGSPGLRQQVRNRKGASSWKRCLKPLCPYDLRHTCATLLLAGGEHPKVVAERLGHSSTVMTMDVYSHVLPDMQEAAADKLERLLFGA